MLADLQGAFSFLTVLPVGFTPSDQAGRSWGYFPLVGLVIGAGLAGIAVLKPFSPDLTAFLCLLFWVIITGGLHLDGWGDSCDSLFAMKTPDQRLEIMRDPRMGSWGVIGLILLLLGKWLALRELPHAEWLLLPPIVARWNIVLAAFGFTYARPDGLGAYFRQGFGRTQVILATSLTIILLTSLTLFLKDERLLSLLLSPILVWGVGNWASGRLGGGITGDVYGMIGELTELLSLWVLVSYG